MAPMKSPSQTRSWASRASARARSVAGALLGAEAGQQPRGWSATGRASAMASAAGARSARTAATCWAVGGPLRRRIATVCCALLRPPQVGGGNFAWAAMTVRAPFSSSEITARSASMSSSRQRGSRRSVSARTRARALVRGVQVQPKNREHHQRHDEQQQPTAAALFRRGEGSGGGHGTTPGACGGLGGGG